jgi:2-dehydropantoate 2-reductase
VKVCVVGAGAIGTFLGVHLARSGCEVSTIARGPTAAALRSRGLTLPAPHERIGRRHNETRSRSPE